MLITAFDSGTFTGWAQGQSGLLTSCGFIRVKPSAPMLDLPRSDNGLVYIEEPVHRRNGETVDPNKLIKLGIKVGRLVESYLVFGNTVETILPATWKGGTPKEIQNGRDRDALTRPELDIVVRCLVNIAPGYHNNVWDGIGILLWAMRKAGERK